MENKKYSEVLIDGKIYSLSGAEDQQYLQRVAAYLSEKTAQLKSQEGFLKQSQEYQAVMVELNIADDYFKALDKAEISDRKRDAMERDSYSLKHELVTTQMSLERKEQELADLRKKLEESREETAAVRRELEKSGEETAAVRKELEETKISLEKEKKQYHGQYNNNRR